MDTCLWPTLDNDNAGWEMLDGEVDSNPSSTPTATPYSTVLRSSDTCPTAPEASAKANGVNTIKVAVEEDSPQAARSRPECADGGSASEELEIVYDIPYDSIFEARCVEELESEDIRWEAQWEAGKRRAQLFDEEHRYAFLKGKSACHRPNWSPHGTSLTIERRVCGQSDAASQGLHPVTEVDMAFDLAVGSVRPVGHSYPGESLNKCGRWEEVPASLGELATSSSAAKVQSNWADPRRVEHFALEVVGFLKEDGEGSARSSRAPKYDARRDFSHIYAYKPFHSVSSVSTLTKICPANWAAHPEEVKFPRIGGSRVHLSSSAPCRNSLGRVVPRGGRGLNGALVTPQRAERQSHQPLLQPQCWSPARDDGARDWLEVDLGAEHVVSHVGTFGRPPPVYWYPTHDMLTDAGFTKTNRRKYGHSYSGEYKLVCGRGNTRDQGCWVERYELLCRDERGHAWQSLGIFKGNSDNLFREAVSSLRHLAGAGAPGVRCRYLRFRPLSHSEGGFRGAKAMLVAVYGQPTGGAAAAQDTPGARGSRGAPSAEEEECTVQYTVSAPGQHINRKLAQKSHSTSGWADKYDRSEVQSLRLVKERDIHRHLAACEGLSVSQALESEAGVYTNAGWGLLGDDWDARPSASAPSAPSAGCGLEALSASACTTAAQLEQMGFPAPDAWDAAFSAAGSPEPAAAAVELLLGRARGRGTLADHAQLAEAAVSGSWAGDDAAEGECPAGLEAGHDDDDEWNIVLGYGERSARSEDSESEREDGSGGRCSEDAAEAVGKKAASGGSRWWGFKEAISNVGALYGRAGMTGGDQAAEFTQGLAEMCSDSDGEVPAEAVSAQAVKQKCEDGNVRGSTDPALGGAEEGWSPPPSGTEPAEQEEEEEEWLWRASPVSTLAMDALLVAFAERSSTQAKADRKQKKKLLRRKTRRRVGLEALADR